jgi:endonuclease YncB( thermonuclease family)
VLNEEKQVVGVASVIDGDTIEMHGQRIRLFGVDDANGAANLPANLVGAKKAKSDTQ